MPLFTDLPNFRLAEFRHPELIEEEAAQFLQEVRALYNKPIRVTSDARTETENVAVGGSPTSWHVKGRAFDIALPAAPDDLWALVGAIYAIAGVWHYRPERKHVTVELELVSGPTDKHIHFAVRNDGKPSKLILALD